MSSLKIYINPFTDDNVFYKNSIQLGSKSHSPFRNLSKTPIFGWIKKLPSLAENELNDKYDLIVSAHEFEASLIRIFMKGNQMCSSIRCEDFEVALPVSERMILNSTLIEKYGAGTFPIQQQNYFTQNNEDNYLHITVGDFHYYLSEDVEESLDFKSDGLIWKTSNIDDTVRIIRERFVDIPFLKASHTLLEEKREKMTESDKDIFDSVLLTSPIIIPTIKQEIEVGTSSDVIIKVLPEFVPCPELNISIDNPAFTVNRLTITANAVGSGVLSVSRLDDPEKSTLINLSSYKHNYVTSINLYVQNSIMEYGSKQEFSVSIEPVDAEDASKLSIISDNPDIIRIVDQNTIEAVKSGTGTIVASCNKCQEKLQITVLPKLDSAKLSIDDKSELRLGDSLIARVVLEPSDAFHHDVFVESGNSSIISVEHYVEDEYRIKAKGLGEGELIVKDENGRIISRQVIKVISTLYQQKNKKKPSFTAFIALVLFISSCIIGINLKFAGQEYVLIALIGLALLLSLWSMFKEKRNYFISIVVTAISAVCLYFMIEETINKSQSNSEIVEQTDSKTNHGTGNKK